MFERWAASSPSEDEIAASPSRSALLRRPLALTITSGPGYSLKQEGIGRR